MTPNSPDFRMARPEFVALIAMMFSTIAFSIDAMLPALPQIGQELSPLAPERAPLILSAFLMGMGLGTFITGPLSDAFGRRPVIFAGAALYILSSAVAWASESLELMLVARLFQGLGAAGPRVVAMAVIRDLYSGREMAKIASLVMMIFALVPAIAPALGAQIIWTVGWRGIFAAFVIFSLISLLWMGFRLPETLPAEKRRPLRVSLMVDAVRQMFAHPVVRLSILVQALAMSMLFVTLMQIQQIYDVLYGRAETFPYWFCLVAILAASASLLNALLVVRYGMQMLITITLSGQVLLSFLFLVLDLGHTEYGFAFFVLWQTCLFFQAGLTLGNLNALAMEPMGHIAGMAASVIGAVATITAAALTAPLGTLFDGTERPLILSVLVMAIAAFLLMIYMHVVTQRSETKP